MPLDPTFWDDPLDPVAPPAVSGFPFKVKGLSNFPTPTRFLRINPGDELRVSWAPPEHSWARPETRAPVVVNVQRSRRDAYVYGLVIGFVSNMAHPVGWLRITPKLLKTLSEAYEGIDPGQRDCIIKRHANSGWQVMVEDDNALEALKGTADYLTLTGKIRSVVTEWPGDRVL